mgnify:CR=1 FL=1
MAVTAYAEWAGFFGKAISKAWRQPQQRSRLGDFVLLAFLLAQCLDGVMTYVGVITFGIGIEANPLVAGLMTHLGHGTGVMSAKLLASTLGICLHLCQIHAAVALLTGLYFLVAIAPWTFVLFF